MICFGHLIEMAFLKDAYYLWHLTFQLSIHIHLFNFTQCKWLDTIENLCNWVRYRKSLCVMKWFDVGMKYLLSVNFVGILHAWAIIVTNNDEQIDLLWTSIHAVMKYIKFAGIHPYCFRVYSTRHDKMGGKLGRMIKLILFRQ